MEAGGQRAWKPFLLVVLFAAAGFGSMWANVRTSDSASNGPDDAATEAGTVSVREALTSWNPNVQCPTVRTTFAELFGPAYPSQNVSGAPYQWSATAGGIPHQRDLTPPCTITNVTGVVHTTHVQIDGVYLMNYGVQTGDCSTRFKTVNGGQPYPNNATVCDNMGFIREVGTTNPFMQIEIDQDWIAAGFCGPGRPPCDNAALLEWQSSDARSLDVQGFVHWDGENWEMHPFTAAKLS